MTKVAVVLTCHNRAITTLRCLYAVAMQNLCAEETSIHIYLVDSDSTDGTADLVRQQYPMVNVIHCSRDVFWNRGMIIGWQHARVDGFDYILWLNDDTILDTNAVRKLLETCRAEEKSDDDPVVVAGATRDPRTSKITYGGLRKAGILSGLKLRLVAESTDVSQIDTMNGNCVMINVAATEVIGILDSAFSHSMGDIDYGLRAKALGVKVLLAPGTVGTCERNSLNGTWKDKSLTFKERWKLLISVKGLPFSEWRLLCRRHAGPIWPVVWAAPYARVILDSFLSFTKRPDR